MSDLTKRLRMGTQVPEFELRQEAADEIERLRAALERIARGCDLSNEAQAIAREALKDE